MGRLQARFMGTVSGNGVLEATGMGTVYGTRYGLREALGLGTVYGKLQDPEQFTGSYRNGLREGTGTVYENGLLERFAGTG